MEQQLLDNFRRALLSLKDEIEELNSTGKDAADTVVLDQSKVGRLSRMDALQAQQMAQETTRRRHMQLKKIVGALRRLDEGEYGFCQKCGEGISMGRLEFDPACTRCINCADS